MGLIRTLAIKALGGVPIEQVHPRNRPDRLTGVLTLLEYDVESNEEMSREVSKNLTLLAGKRLGLELIFGNHTHFVQYLAAGDNATIPALADVTLYNELLRGTITSAVFDDDGANGLATIRYVMGTTQGNGETFREAGLFNDNDVMYARVVHSDKAKTSSKIIIYQWDLTFA